MQRFPLDKENIIEAGFLDKDTLEKLKISHTPNEPLSYGRHGI